MEELDGWRWLVAKGYLPKTPKDQACWLRQAIGWRHESIVPPEHSRDDIVAKIKIMETCNSWEGFYGEV